MSGSYKFILIPANHGVELAAIDLQAPMGEVATAFINEAHLPTIKKHKIISINCDMGNLGMKGILNYKSTTSDNTMTLQYLTEQELKNVAQKWAKDTKGRGEAVRTEKGWLLFDSDEEFKMWRQNVMIKPNYLYQDFEEESSLQNYREINEKLTAIQSAFGVSAKQLAELLNVPVDDIFRWTRQEILPSDNTINRLENLSRFAKIWNSHSNFPADDHFFEKNEEGHSLHDLLKNDSSNTETITRNIQKTATQTEIFFAKLKNNAASVVNDSEGSEFDFWDLEACRLPETNRQI